MCSLEFFWSSYWEPCMELFLELLHLKRQNLVHRLFRGIIECFMSSYVEALMTIFLELPIFDTSIPKRVIITFLLYWPMGLFWELIDLGTQ